MHSIYEDERIFKFYNHVGKVVKVTLSNKKSTTGTVCSIDPVSGSIVLLEIVSKKLQILMGHSVVSIEDCSDLDADDVSRVLPDHNSQRASNNVGIDSVKNWLLKNRMVCEESGNGILIVGGAVSICAPYTEDMCTGDNELVVDRIRELLSKMPIN
ncbi:uncharacterized protein LOC135934173 [Cloeon dipterum]|uniref:uncharacterized protein LOC135934173 n=1 Tax=Cloeon dipterum TaxID=197152 RepID=UPI0032209DF0